MTSLRSTLTLAEHRPRISSFSLYFNYISLFRESTPMASKEEQQARQEAKEAAKAETAPLAVATVSKKNAQDFSELVNARIPECVQQAKVRLHPRLAHPPTVTSPSLIANVIVEWPIRCCTGPDARPREEDADRALLHFPALLLIHQGEDMASTRKVLEGIVDICTECKEWKALEESVTSLSKRRGLIKESFKGMVKKAALCLDLPLARLPLDAKFSLFDTLLAVTEGRIFVEKQRARLVLKLAHIRESEGKVAEAAKLLQEVQVETFGAMKKQEKTEYILEQMRMCLLKKDYVRTQIISRKIHPKGPRLPSLPLLPRSLTLSAP